MGANTMTLLSDEQRLKIIYGIKEEAVTDFLTRDVGPYEVTKLTFTAERLFDAIEAAVLEAQGKQEPVAWCVAYDDPRMGRIHSNPTMCEPEVDAHVSKCGGVVVKVPLFAAPVVQSDMVMVPREATHAMCEAAHFGPNCAEDKLRSSDRQFWEDCYRTMIAAAEEQTK